MVGREPPTRGSCTGAVAAAYQPLGTAARNKVSGTRADRPGLTKALDMLRATQHGLHARPAEAIDGERRHLDGQAGLEPDVPGTVVRVDAALLHVAEDDVLHPVGLHTRPGQCPARGDGARGGGAHHAARAAVVDVGGGVDARAPAAVKALGARESARPARTHRAPVEHRGAHHAAAAAAPRVGVEVDAAGAALRPPRAADAARRHARLPLAAHRRAGAAVGGVGLELDAAREPPLAAERAGRVARRRAAPEAARHPRRARGRAGAAVRALPAEVEAPPAARGLARVAGGPVDGGLGAEVGRSVGGVGHVRRVDPDVHRVRGVGRRRDVRRGVERGEVGGGVVGRELGGEVAGRVDAGRPHHAPLVAAPDGGAGDREERREGVQATVRHGAIVPHPRRRTGLRRRRPSSAWGVTEVGRRWYRAPL